MDRFSKTCLVLIVALLAAIALRPVISPQSAHAAQLRQYSYYLIGIGRLDDAEKELTGFSMKGYEVVGVTAVGQYNNQVLFILAK